MNRSVSLAAVLCACCISTFAADWQPKQAPLMTKWAKDVTPQNVHAEYPRPQMVREHWMNLNGLWEYAIRPNAEGTPTAWEREKILVPVPVESALSGVMKPVGPENRLWYRRSFSVPTKDGKVDAAWAGKNVLLHFGAVDWETTVWLNGKEVGSHQGGYDPFTFDISAALKADGPNELIVSVWDGSDAGYQARGKQVRKPGGIFYTPTTGIWQTVWLEPVPKTYIRSVNITPMIDADTATLDLSAVGPGARSVAVKKSYVVKGGPVVGAEQTFTLRLTGKPLGMDSSPEFRKIWWTPTSPTLIDVELSLLDESDHVIDVVSTYFAMRKISLGKDEKGVNRLMLNNKFVFQYGPLDQGFWPDGLYTAPTDEALKFDIEQTKAYGFNMIRKHVKVEPARWYYHCDKLGMLVWQDMPSGDRFIGPNDPDIQRSPESTAQFEKEWLAIIDALRNFPSIVMWVPFNEGWGQFDTARIVELTKQHDPTRLVNNASGWSDRNVGDVHDLHVYPGPASPKPTDTRAAVLGEFGGLGLPLEGHTWKGKENWGYRSFTDQPSLTNAYFDLIEQLHPLIGSPGLSAAVYTQTTDVETEVNGLMTYDRKVMKIPVEAAAKAHRALYLPPPQTKVLVATSQKEAQTWKFTLDKPADGWEKSAFDDASWKSGPGGFGEKSTPGSVVRTEWKSNDLWLRRTFELPAVPTGELRLRMHHDEDTEVHINGVLAVKATGWTTDYRSFRLTKEGAAALKAGANTLAVHCLQRSGGQYIDVGIVELVPTQ